MTHQILLYYSYVVVSDPRGLAERQRVLCRQLGLKGRLIIAAEGINGTLEGTVEQTENYIKLSALEASFSSVLYKKSEGTGDAFPRLVVRARSEIVSAHLGERDIDPKRITGAYLMPEELHQWINSDREFYIVDIRNNYEHAAGHFSGSFLPPISNFRELPAILPVIEHLKDKTIVAVCTGGVRCEKASGFFMENGFSNVFQLHGGIVTYMELYPNQDFLGALYVFDGRVTMAFNCPKQRTIIGTCERCGASSERYINCLNTTCDRHFICCTHCFDGSHAYCSQLCGSLAPA